MQDIIHTTLEMRDLTFETARQQKNKKKPKKKNKEKADEIRLYAHIDQTPSIENQSRLSWDEVQEVWKHKKVKLDKRGNRWFTQVPNTLGIPKVKQETFISCPISEGMKSNMDLFYDPSCKMETTSNTLDHIDLDNNFEKKCTEIVMVKNVANSNLNNSSDNSSPLKEDLLKPTHVYLELDDLLKKNMYGEELTKMCCFQSLKPREQLCGDVISSFLKHTEKVANDYDFNTIITFDTTFCVNNLYSDKNNSSDGYYKFAKKVHLERYDVWLIPVHVDKCHWTLLIVNVSGKCLICLDSLDWEIPVKLIPGVQKYMRDTIFRNTNIINWDEWTVYKPGDVPRQNLQGNNCGCYVLTWEYAIATSSYTHFKEKDMENVRINIQRILFSKKENNTDRRLKRMCTNSKKEDLFTMLYI